MLGHAVYEVQAAHTLQQPTLDLLPRQDDMLLVQHHPAADLTAMFDDVRQTLDTTASFCKLNTINISYRAD